MENVEPITAYQTIDTGLDDLHIESLPTEDISAVLMRADYAINAFMALPDNLPEMTTGWTAEQWNASRQALVQCWRNFQPDFAGIDVAHKFVRFAWAVELWWLVRGALAATLEFGGESAEVWAWLGGCESQCGRQDEAVGCLMQALSLDRKAPEVSRLIAEIGPRWAQQHTLFPAARNGPVLRLEPLNVHHAQVLLWQYRDPLIAAWAMTEPLNELNAVCDWIERDRAQPGRHSFAIMHADEGFVGLVSYATSGTAAFIYYWIGCDHQGRGYAATAVAMAYEHAWSTGVTVLFTSCLKENVRSLRVLQRCGFTQLSMPPLTGRDTELDFFTKRLQSGEGDAVLQLKALLANLGWPLELAKGEECV